MNKYDRQIRLWSSSGQERLANAHVLVVGLTAANTEALKNILLAGVARITLCDPDPVSAGDIESNFFLARSAIGANKVEAVCAAVAELNPDVHVQCTNENPLKVLSTNENLSFLSEITLVLLAGNLGQELQNRLLHELPTLSLIQLDSLGFYGRVKVLYNEHVIVETHPDSLVDLRFDLGVWPEYKAHIDSLDLDSLDELELEHVPFCDLLAKVALIWVNEHQRLFETYQDKSEFKLLLKRYSRGTGAKNFDEAVRASWRVWAPVVSSGVKDLMCLANQHKKDSTTAFWPLVSALKEFVDRHNYPPLSGVLPDMSSDSARYAKVLGIYRNKAKADLDEFTRIYHAITASRNLTPLDEVDIQIFCKNSRFARVMVGRPPNLEMKSVLEGLSSPEEPDAKMFAEISLALDAANCSQKWSTVEESLVSLVEAANGILAARGSKVKVSRDSPVLREAVRSGGGELANISALIGGVGAQEALKLIMHQYTPLAHTFVYDGVTASSYSFRHGHVVN